MFGCTGSPLLHGLSLAARAGAGVLSWCRGFSLQRLLLGTGSRALTLSSCTSWALVLGLSSPTAGRIFPDEGLNRCPLL